MQIVVLPRWQDPGCEIWAVRMCLCIVMTDGGAEVRATKQTTWIKMCVCDYMCIYLIKIVFRINCLLAIEFI